MSGPLAAALAVLAILGWVLLILLAVLMLLLCVPVTLTAEYRSDTLTAAARYGPLRFTLYPASPKPRKERHPRKKAGAARAAKAPAPASAGQGSAAPPNRRVQAFLAAFKAEPLVMLEALLAHVSFAGSRLLRGVHVRHLHVFWTVTAPEQDAAATAVLYGAQIAALNNLLVRAREVLDIEADFLRLEPDFTGERRPQRGISGEVFVRPGVLVLLAPRLLWRLWRDPALKAVWQ